MCLWLLTACLGLLPATPNPTTVVIIQGVPTPILQPTTAAPTTTTAATTTTTAPTTSTTTTTTARPPTTAPTTAAPTTMVPTTPPPPTTAPSTAAPPTTAPTTAAPPTTAPTTAAPPTTAPTTAAPPTTAPTTAAPPTTAPTTTTTTARPTSPGNNLISPPPPTVTNTVTSQTTIIINSREELLPVVICNNPDALCISNPDDNASGPLQIDPRVGTTPAESAALHAPPINGYSAQLPLYDTAVRFPRDRRSIKRDKKLITLLDVLGGIQTSTGDNHDIQKRQSCRCVAAGTCAINSTNSGAGMLDVRIVTPASQCPSGQEYCCGSTIINCGTLQTVPTTAVAPAAGQASFGEFPWQALILTKQNDYLAGGVLIDRLNVLTVTHRLTSYIVSGTAPNVKVRLGEWDAAGTYEPVPFQEYTVQKVFSHASYNANTLQYDITVLRLSAAVPISPMTGAATTINRACLPPSSTTTYTGQRCWVSGWGKDLFGIQGQYQQILKKVEVPIVASAACQTQMQTARLGSSFVLDTTSFICAGGEANKDSCTGDGGSGLVCQANGQWVVVGLVSWGLGCANANVPAAYVNVAALLPWIQQQVASA